MDLDLRTALVVAAIALAARVPSIEEVRILYHVLISQHDEWYAAIDDKVSEADNRYIQELREVDCVRRRLMRLKMDTHGREIEFGEKTLIAEETEIPSLFRRPLPFLNNSKIP